MRYGDGTPKRRQSKKNTKLNIEPGKSVCHESSGSSDSNPSSTEGELLNNFDNEREGDQERVEDEGYQNTPLQDESQEINCDHNDNECDIVRKGGYFQIWRHSWGAI